MNLLNHPKQRSLLQIHTAIFLFGIAGLFGKWIHLPSMVLVLGRSGFSALFLLFLLLMTKKEIRLKSVRHYGIFFLMGLVLALHWTSFYAAIQLSTIAIALLTFSTFPVFVTFMEPLFFHEKIKKTAIVTALLTLFGVLLVVPSLKIENSASQGALFGIFSGFSYAALSLLNRRYVVEYSGAVLSFYEQAVSAVLLLPCLFLYKPVFELKDVGLLILLGTVFTGIAHTLFISGLKYIKTQTAGIITSLEPVYAIILAAVLLGEIPSLKEVTGGVFILGAVVFSTIQAGRQNGRQS